MKKIILTEILIFLVIAGISVGLYQLFFGIDLSVNNYFDLMIYDIKRMYIIYGIVICLFLPIYLVLNFFRLIYFRFQKIYVLIEIIISSLGLMSYYAMNYLMLSSGGLSPAEEGWTIYPPLSGIPQLNEVDTLRLENDKNNTLFIIAVTFISLIALTILTIKLRKKYRSQPQ